MKLASKLVSFLAVAGLAAFFKRNGYVRHQNPRRLTRDGYRNYKKGDEVRLTAVSKRELDAIRRLLRQAGFKPGRPFIKGRQYRQPVYGRTQVARFLKVIKHKIKSNKPRQIVIRRRRKVR